MPFTAAHPLAVVPLLARRLRLDPTCLVIGSMSPDFEYFARVKLAGRIGHTLPGLALWCIPITLFTAWLFHRAVKWPALRAAPAPIARRLAAFAERPWMPTWTVRPIAVLVVSALIGAITHDLWDGITHRDMWGPQHVAALRDLYTVPVLGLMPLHRIIQHTSTAVALPIVAILVWRALLRVTPVDVVTGGRVVWFASVAVCTAAAYAKMVLRHETDVGSLVVAACCGLIGGALVAGLIALRRQAVTNSRRLPRHPR